MKIQLPLYREFGTKFLKFFMPKNSELKSFKFETTWKT